eukprot:TRINITY_DN14913_c4_g1_i1.p1 TRINITY_DN14913_c4_g1~~TRINITY_DN14913_c4_g1_i1.p1  ORF type:complete len:446 (+),score=142.06 TRINITY_DN14913_c4_g1_i1:71-1408(+)
MGRCSLKQLPPLAAALLLGVLCGRLLSLPALPPASPPPEPPRPSQRAEHARQTPPPPQRGDERETRRLREQLAQARRDRESAGAEAERLRREAAQARALREELAACQQQAEQDARQQSEGSGDGGGEGPTPYLGIGIPTVPRDDLHHPGHPLRYLERTLRSITKQVSDSVWEGRVVIWVMNMRPGRHAVFAELRELWANDFPYVHFIENTEPLEDRPDDPLPPVHPLRRQQRPTATVRRQTLDVARLLQHAAGKSRYFLFYEDDFELCDNGLMALGYMIQRATDYHRNWVGIRCSFGLAGIVMRNTDGGYDDLKVFGDYMRKHYARRPPDHLVVEWYAGEVDESKEHVGERRVMAFRHNILHHIGSQSTVRASKHWSFPGCFADLIAPQVFAVEAWNPVECPRDDLWPCDGPRARPSTLAWSTDDSLRVQKGTVVYVDKGRALRR